MPAPSSRLPRWSLVLALLPGCGFFGAGADPFQIAFRGGAGYWPENSRVAVDNALAAQYDGLHVDVVVTNDEVAVMHRGAYLSPELCTAENGAPFTADEVRIGDLSFEDLEDLYRCGGIANPDYPEASTAEDTLAPLSYLVEALANGNSGALVQLNVIYKDGDTTNAESVARSVLDTWFLVDPGNRFYLSADNADIIAALDAHAAEIGRDGQVTTSLVWPDNTSFGASAAADLGQTLGLADPVAQARAANADGVMMAAEMMDRQMARKAQSAGLQVQVWDADGKAREGAFARWPVDVVVTAFPGDEVTP